MRRRRSTRARDKTSRDMNEVDTGDGWEKGITMTSKAHWAVAKKGGSSRRQPALWARVDGSAVLVLETQCLSLRHRSSDCGDGLE
jgi:hypothetical protein